MPERAYDMPGDSEFIADERIASGRVQISEVGKAIAPVPANACKWRSVEPCSVFNEGTEIGGNDPLGAEPAASKLPAAPRSPRRSAPPPPPNSTEIATARRTAAAAAAVSRNGGGRAACGFRTGQPAGGRSCRARNAGDAPSARRLALLGARRKVGQVATGPPLQRAPKTARRRAGRAPS